MLNRCEKIDNSVQYTSQHIFGYAFDAQKLSSYGINDHPLDIMPAPALVPFPNPFATIIGLKRSVQALCAGTVL